MCCDPHRQDVECIGFLLAPRSGLGDTRVKLPSPISRPASAASSSTETTVITPSYAQEQTKQMLLGFGATRRGACGEVSTRSYSSCDGTRVEQGDIGITHTDGATKKLTDGGDCGTIFIDEYGHAVSMHHVLRTTRPRGTGMATTYESFGVPMLRIVDAHTLLGGAGHPHDAEDGSVGSVSPVHTETFQGGAHDIDTQHDIAYFRITIQSAQPGICESHQLAHIPFCIKG